MTTIGAHRLRVAQDETFEGVACRSGRPSDEAKGRDFPILRRWSGLIPANLDFALMPAGLGEIIGRLETHPVIGLRPPCFFQPYRHLRRNSGMAVQNAGKSVAGDAKHARAVRYT